MRFPILTPEEAAELFFNDAHCGFSGFTAPGSPKVVTQAIAAKAERLHAQGEPFKINIITGASTSDRCDGILARANAVGKRTPYQNHPDLRKRINSHDAHYFDLHLSEAAQKLRYGFFGDLDLAIIEVSDIQDDGTCVVGTGVGNVPTIAKMAKKIVIELNEKLRHALYGIHDIYLPLDPPNRTEIPIFKPSDRIGSPVLKLDPEKIVGVVMSDHYEGVKPFTPLDDTTKQIGANVCTFLINELHAGRIPSTFLPLQSGVGNVANAVLYGLADAKEIPPFEMYTEVIQDAVIDLMKQGRCKFGSTCSLTVSNEVEDEVISNIEFFRNHLIIRMMNGIGGSGDFTRNAYISIFSCPSITKEGKISNIVPMASHVDHTEHSVDVLVTDQGIADLRGLDPVERAHEIINKCAHPIYRELLNDYLKLSTRGGQTPHTLEASLAFHTEFLASGDMRNVDWSKFA